MYKLCRGSTYIGSSAYTVVGFFKKLIFEKEIFEGGLCVVAQVRQTDKRAREVCRLIELHITLITFLSSTY